VLKPGGLAIHTTCFINPIHEAPTRYTAVLHATWHPFHKLAIRNTEE
jgi:hypothetical protein